jgi:hypothetical protein
MDKHAKTPWRYQRGDRTSLHNGRIFDAKGNTLVLRAVMDEKDEATMLLLSASPKLLEACRAVLLWAKTPGNHGGNPYSKPFVKAAEIAVAAAEGREPEDWAQSRQQRRLSGLSGAGEHEAGAA